MIDHLLICTDLDRTLLPNGSQPESPFARKKFSLLTAKPEISLAYVSGRNKQLIIDAISEFDIPFPNFVIGDVGTSIYSVSKKNNLWKHWESWHKEISKSWHGWTHDDLAELFIDMKKLQLQEPEKQSKFKLSYYITPENLNSQLIEEINIILERENINTSVVWSLNEFTHTGLIDILPESATKLHAIEFLMKKTGFSYENTMFAGDSGNDMPVLTSRLNSVLVHNATFDVKKTAKEQAEKQGTQENLYIAKGKKIGLNGNYSAGILEGVYHYYPEIINNYR